MGGSSARLATSVERTPSEHVEHLLVRRWGPQVDTKGRKAVALAAS